MVLGNWKKSNSYSHARNNILREIEQQERLNDIQNQIFKSNEKMEGYKLEMNFNQEELEQWSLAAKQKEEDNLALEKYKRQDEIKVKELNLEIEKLTVYLCQFRTFSSLFRLF